MVGAASVAQAQTGSDLELDDVVVTARRVVENLQDSPVAVTSFDAASIERRAIRTIADIGKFTPSLQFDAAAPAAGSGNAVTVFLRGIGQTDFLLTVDPGVGIYVDGVYVSRSIGALLQTHDIDSVQVLRGPQGTLFGKNTVGGAIVVTTRGPTDELAGGLRLTTGRFDRRDASGWISMPASDELRFYLSAYSSMRDGYVRRLVDGDLRGDEDQQGARFVMEWLPADNFSARLALDGMRSRQAAIGSVLLEMNENAAFPVFNNIFLNAPACLPPSPVGNPNCYNAQFLTGSTDSAFDTADADSDTDVLGAALTLDWTAGAVEIKSISAYREIDAYFSIDIDHSPLLIQTPINDYTQEQFSQEFQFSGEALEERLRWVFGLYYLEETGADLSPVLTAPVTFISGGDIENESYAAFGQAIYGLTDALRLTVGGRYTHERKAFTPQQIVTSVHPAAQAPLPPGSPSPFFLTNPVTTILTGTPQPIRVGDRILPQERASITASEFTPSLTLDYRLSDDSLVYATYSQGFKSGGFTQRVFPPEFEIPSFEPEFARVYELGAKAQFLDDRLRLNGAVFRTDYSDLQIVVNDGFAPKTRNAGEARIQGVELELEWLALQWLRVSGGVSYLDGEYTEIDARAFPVGIDSNLANTPEWTGSLGATATAYDGTHGRLELQTDWAYRGRHFKDAVNTPVLEQDGVNLLNVSATFTHRDQGWSVAAGVTNVTDERYLVTGLSETQFIGATYGVFSRPREWFVRLGYDF
jgi:iron complex outermembrane receptor protein